MFPCYCRTKRTGSVLHHAGKPRFTSDFFLQQWQISPDFTHTFSPSADFCVLIGQNIRWKITGLFPANSLVLMFMRRVRKESPVSALKPEGFPTPSGQRDKKKNTKTKMTNWDLFFNVERENKERLLKEGVFIAAMTHEINRKWLASWTLDVTRNG